jgi:hypothetical protein
VYQIFKKFNLISYVSKKSDLHNIEFNLLMVLNRFPLNDDVIANFAQYQITYAQLKTMNREDLKKMGIHDNRLQEEMLCEFKQLQSEHSSPPPPKKEKEKEKTITEHLSYHLFNINALLAATSFQVGSCASSSAASNVVINNNFLTSEVVLDLLGQLSTHTVEMERIIRMLKDPEEFEKQEQEFNKIRLRQKRRKYLMAISGGSAAIIIFGILWANRLKGIFK